MSKGMSASSRVGFLYFLQSFLNDIPGSQSGRRLTEKRWFPHTVAMQGTYISGGRQQPIHQVTAEPDQLPLERYEPPQEEYHSSV